MREQSGFPINGISTQFLAIMVSIFVILGAATAPAFADTATDDVQKIVWQFNNDKHVFYQKTNQRWEAVAYGQTSPWGGYQKSVVGNDIKLQANSTDFVQIDLQSKQVYLNKSGNRELWGQVLHAFDLSGQDIYRKEVPAPLSKEETQQWMEWISAEMSALRVPYCYKNSYGRGVGKPVSNCPAGQEQQAGLCYNQCNAGFTGVANSCNASSCPSGWRDDGLFCAKPNLSTQCPAGFKDIGISCAKATYDRGVGKPLSCGPGEEQDGGLCYPSCQAGSTGVGPVCWSSCPANRSTDCAAGCAVSHEACVVQTFEMAEAPVSAAISLVTMGLDNSLKTAADAGTSAARGTATQTMANSGSEWAKLGENLFTALEQGLDAYDKVSGVLTVQESLQAEIEHWVNVYSEPANFEDATSKKINFAIEWAYYADGTDTRIVKARYIREQWALNHLGVLTTTDGFETAGNVLSAVSVFDPTGLLNVANVYAKPVCGASVEPPRSR